ncbi:ankyrin repeat domain-containing protein [Streptomyces sp. NPDC058459]|uniref:ankyrin repeat domain-containing protein n=1 Tax=Streptomyces sp. NPDC058459 TaxID=3346508 RepID=UPI00365C2C19
MGFFDDLVLPGEPLATERSVLARLRPPGQDEGRYTPPVDRFVPVPLSQPVPAGAGPETRVMLTGWSAWPVSVTLHLAVFRRTRRQGGLAPGQSGLRVGLLLSDGRRVTSLDGTTTRRVPFTGTDGEVREAQTAQAVGLIPLDPRLHHSHRSLFKTDVDLYLPELPPPGEATLVVEWPDEGIAETRVPVDADALRTAAGQAVEVWPDLEAPEPDEGPGTIIHMEVGGPRSFLAPPLNGRQTETLRREEEARQRLVPRPDWDGMRSDDWADLALIEARLAGGAPPRGEAGWSGGTPLHLTAEQGSVAGISALLAHGADVDARDDFGHTPLWYAALRLKEAAIRTLIDAGADVWTPQEAPWSPGRLLLTTPLAPLVSSLPGAEELPAEEVAALRAADALVAAFGDDPLWTDGLGICFVRDLTEDEVIRRLGAEPARCPRTGLADAPFDTDDFDEIVRHVGVRAVQGAPGGCVITQDGYLTSDPDLLSAISAGTTAYGVYFNPKGGSFGSLARDGEFVGSEEIGMWGHGLDPDAFWTFRLWQREPDLPFGADALAYACAAAGLVIEDGREAVDRHAPRRWVELPPEPR